MIKITEINSETIEVDFNGLDKDYQKLIIKKCHVRTLALTIKKGVEIILSSDNSEFLNYLHIDNVGGVNPSTDEELFNLLNAMF